MVPLERAGRWGWEGRGSQGVAMDQSPGGAVLLPLLSRRHLQEKKKEEKKEDREKTYC